MNATKPSITIFADHVWAGQGCLSDGSVTDCPAVLGGSQNACEIIYDLIDEAIADGKSSIAYDGVRYDWTID